MYEVPDFCNEGTASGVLNPRSSVTQGGGVGYTLFLFVYKGAGRL